ncbi:MAG: NACHT domain-containing protein [Acidobacteria bacterium]|nr:NACHT domain-containing protein [Acidobacteriota bacterium]
MFEFDANLENNSYIPLAAHYSVSGRRADRKWTNEEKTEDFELLAENWIESGTPFFVSILADYGSGKTTLLNRLKYRYARKYLESESKIKPLYLPLRDFHKFGSLDDFLSASFSKEFSREIPLDIVWRSAASKEILFLIDGFDEMLVRNDQASRLDAFVSISRLLTTAACAFLTCRPSFFVTEEEYEEMVDSVNKIEGAKPAVISITDFSSDRRLQAEQLHSKLLKSLVGYSPLESLTSKISCKVAIESLTHTQIESFLNQFNELYLKTFNRSAQDVRDFLFGIYDLEDLMKRPILLRIIHETVLDGSLSLNSDVESLGPSTLYTIYTNMKLDIDWLRGTLGNFLRKKNVDTLRKHWPYLCSIVVKLMRA